MGFLGKIGNAIQKIDYHISNDPEIVGKRFEDHVQNLFSTKYFKIVEKTHSFKTNTERYVDSSKNPDFIFEYIPTREKFAVECKYRTQLNKKNQLEWSYPAQLKRYQEFEYQRRLPVFIVIGLELAFEHEDDPDDIEYEKFMFNIPLKDAKYPALYESVFANFEREYGNHSSGKMGNYIELFRCGYYLVTLIHTEKGVKQKMFKTCVLFPNR
jgi:hypothetical protein